MVRDDYAGNEGTGVNPNIGSCVRIVYRIDAELDALTLHRVIGVFTVFNVPPMALQCCSSGVDMKITALFDAVPPALAEITRRRLLQLSVVFDAEIELLPGFAEFSNKSMSI